jgi:hypothetical protein
MYSYDQSGMADISRSDLAAALREELQDVSSRAQRWPHVRLG